jgi:hypothetical protein
MKPDHSKKRRGRPSKGAVFLIHNRTPEGEDFGITREIYPGHTPKDSLSDEEIAELHLANRLATLKRLRIDPHGHFEDVTMFMIPILFPEEDGEPDMRDQCRAWLANAVETWSAEEVSVLFQKITKLKAELEQLPSRIYWLFLAYHEYILEFDFEPSKKRLKKYASGKKNWNAGFPSIAPDANNDTQWKNDLFLPAGLASLDE